LLIELAHADALLNRQLLAHSPFDEFGAELWLLLLLL
jgi:hypothetical protein